MPMDTLDNLAELTRRLCGAPSALGKQAQPPSVDKKYLALLQEILALIQHSQPSLVPELTELIDKHGYGEKEDER
jgi:hypothetical protein